MALDALAAALATDLEQIVRLLRSLNPPGGLSMTAAATLASLERLGPQRLTLLAAREGVTQPAMTQLISRLEGLSAGTRARKTGGSSLSSSPTRAGRRSRAAARSGPNG
jgi:DNA-binding MarR family transcriptional regulator